MLLSLTYKLNKTFLNTGKQSSILVVSCQIEFLPLSGSGLKAYCNQGNVNSLYLVSKSFWVRLVI